MPDYAKAPPGQLAREILENIHKSVQSDAEIRNDIAAAQVFALLRLADVVDDYSEACPCDHPSDDRPGTWFRPLSYREGAGLRQYPHDQSTTAKVEMDRVRASGL